MDCEKDLSEALPALEAAENALKVLSPADLTELKAMKQPPQPVKNVMRALCLILYPNPSEKMKAPDGLRFVTDWWAASLKVLGQQGLLQTLLNFDKENMDEKVVKNLGQFLSDPEFKESLEVQNVEKASNACKCIIMWIKGVYDFFFVNKKVRPKKLALNES